MEQSQNNIDLLNENKSLRFEVEDLRVIFLYIKQQRQVKELSTKKTLKGCIKQPNNPNYEKRQKSVHFDPEQSNIKSESVEKPLKLIKPEHIVLDVKDSEDSEDNNENSIPEIRIDENTEHKPKQKNIYQTMINKLQEELRKLKDIPKKLNILAKIETDIKKDCLEEYCKKSSIKINANSDQSNPVIWYFNVNRISIEKIIYKKNLLKKFHLDIIKLKKAC